MIGTGFSLWLPPEEPVSTILNLIIARMAERTKTSPFSPHVTVLADVQLPEAKMVAKTRELALQLEPFKVKFERLDSNNTYFQMLFARVTKTPEVMGTRVVAEKVFGLEPDEYNPHVSFLYGDLMQRDVENLKGIIEPMLPQNPAFRYFEVSRLELWRTIGTVADWDRITTFPLGG